MKRVSLRQIKERFSNESEKHKLPKANGILLIFTLVIVFVVPAFPVDSYANYINYFLTSGSFLSAAYILKRDRYYLVGIAVLVPTLVLIGKLTNIELLTSIFKLIQFFFFLFIVGHLIVRVSQISSVTVEVIVDSVVGYLLLGFAYAIIVTIVSLWIPNAYNVSIVDGVQTRVLQDSIYYTFVTFTTTGYGDILPTHPISKSLAILIGVSGQLYLAVIIAMLVGKYASTGNKTL